MSSFRRSLTGRSRPYDRFGRRSAHLRPATFVDLSGNDALGTHAGEITVEGYDGGRVDRESARRLNGVP
jgi:hypothetical protein